MVEEKKLLENDDELMKKLDKIQNELMWNRVAMAIFFTITMFYIHQETSNICGLISTFIEIFMPN